MSKFNDPSLRILISDQSASRRMLVGDVVRELGYSSTSLFRSGREVLDYLEVETADWIITSVMPEESVNALQILRVLTETPRLRTTKVTLILTPDEDDDCVALAFEYGLLSVHRCGFSRELLVQDLNDLLCRIKEQKEDTTLVAAEYLRGHLLKKRHHRSLLSLEENLINLYPGSARLLISLAQAQALNNRPAEATGSLQQAILLNPNLEEEADHIAEKYLPDLRSEDDENPDACTLTNALGIETCVLIDPDTAVIHCMTSLLRQAGVPRVITFEDGDAAYVWLKQNAEPSVIIQEWRLPNLAGPLFIQRIRNLGHVRVPIIVASSLIHKEDFPIIQEMGVSTVIEKPFDQKNFFNELVWTIQQNRKPTEQISFERKIRAALQTGKHAEAQRFKALYMENDSFSEGSKRLIEAEFSFQEGDLEAARDLAVAALKIDGENLATLNLLGKCLLKLRDFDLALKCFNKAQALSPSNLERLCRIAETEQELGRIEDAAKTLEHAKAQDAENYKVIQASTLFALSTGNLAEAQLGMENEEAISGILAGMNNKAIALIHGGRFIDGIQLYRKTLLTLPGEWSRYHDVVSYNLGLAFARYGEMANAIEALTSIRQTNTSLHKKKKSLEKRVRTAMDNGTSFSLCEKEVAKPTAEEAKEKPKSELAAVLVVEKGQMCCFLTFRCVELVSAATVKLLVSYPKFIERKPIERDEAFTDLQRKTG